MKSKFAYLILIAALGCFTLPFCVDHKAPPALLPGEWVCSTQRPQKDETTEREARPPDPLQGVAARGKQWPVGGTVKVGFLAGTPIEQDSFRRACSLVSTYANLNFDFPATGPYHIRVDFKNAGAWSYIGTDANFVQAGPTLNLAPWALNQRGVYVHELLHGISFLHEQQHPTGVCLDTLKTLAFYRATQGWSDQQIYWNVITKHVITNVIMNSYDIGSVMHYPVPASITCNGVGVAGGRFLTGGDIALLKTLYPGRGAPPVEPPTTGKTLTAAQVADLKAGSISVQQTVNAAKVAADAHRAKIINYLGQ